jgi:hypothetical protein
MGWDERKNRSNRNKHGVDFREAKSVFYDDYALLIDDPEHSDGEDRFVLMGLSTVLRLLVVCHCYRRDGDVVRSFPRSLSPISSPPPSSSS